jgi:hypothetical protein
MKVLYKTYTQTEYLYCDRFAQSIARRQLSKHIPTHATQQYGGSVFYVCPPMDHSYAMCAW